VIALRGEAIVFTIIFALGASAVCAAPQNSSQQVLNNMANEMVECAAYLAVMSVAMENSDKPDTAKQAKALSDKALERALLITEEAHLKPETVTARFKLALDDMSRRIDKNTSNISILMADYNELCVEVMNNPKKRGRYWVDRLSAPPSR
jgi:hypothetical protein